MPIRYINTDLDLASPADHVELAHWLDSCGIFSLRHAQNHDGSWSSCHETEREYDDPDSNIIAIIEAIEAAPRAIRMLWDDCIQREFNVGYECGDGPWAFNQGLTNSTLRRIVEVGASFRITIYPPDESTDPRNT